MKKILFIILASSLTYAKESCPTKLDIVLAASKIVLDTAIGKGVGKVSYMAQAGPYFIKGSITIKDELMNKVPAGKYLFHMNEDEEGILVEIGTKEVWEEQKCLNDHYTDEEQGELGPILDELDLFEICESTFYPTEHNDKELLRQQLLDRGFEENKPFSEFLESCR